MEDIVFRIKSDFFKGLAHPIRLQVIEYLKDKESNVGKLVEVLGVEQSNLSRHLTILKELGILKTRREKTTVYYSIHDPDIFKVLRPMSEILRKKIKRSEKLLEHLGKGEKPVL